MIPLERIHPTNSLLIRFNGSFVLYWMQASVRSSCNHALEYALEQAALLNQPLLVFFGLTPNYPEANARMYRFLLEGLSAVQTGLQARDIPFQLEMCDPPTRVLELSQQASMLVTDRGYLRLARAWRSRVAEQITCPMLEVESEAVVPLGAVSNKQEYAARTLRPKIHKLLGRFVLPLTARAYTPQPLTIELPTSLDLSDLDTLMARLEVDPSVPAVTTFLGGELEARKHLNLFLEQGLAHYAEGRGGPLARVSNLSPYLHYGHLSPLEVVLSLQEFPESDAKAAFLEELIVRRELSFNFCWFNPNYDSFEAALPNWAKLTLQQHADDPRAHLYTLTQLESAQTHDPYWNAAQLEMVKTGKMSNYMRMYWGKKVLEWTPSPQIAWDILIYMNNKYELDGRDPNSFTGIAWCFGNHDRPWTRRAIFGTVRYMNASGLERKFDMKAYLKKVNDL